MAEAVAEPTPVAEALGAFLSQPRIFDWDRLNCCLWVADWIVERRGVDPAKSLRKPVGGERGIALLVHRRGGLLALVADLAAVAGLSETEELAIGDFGLIEILTPRGLAPVAAIFAGQRWAVLQPEGLLMVRAMPLAAWRV